LGHGSDLDLVFLHDANPSGYTDGERSIDNATFFTRLGQRMIHILNTQTASGYLYEVDTRLRPSGNSGMLVTTLQSFKRYQQEGAWTWEHQALVRARAIAGNEKRVDEFNSIRRDVLCRPRDATKLKADIVQMREKMRGHLGTKPRLAGGKKTNKFHLKQDAGGIVDIEFIVQFYVLSYASQYNEISVYTDNVRILNACSEAGLMKQESAEELKAIYLAYRKRLHQLSLQLLSEIVDADVFAKERSAIQNYWASLLH